jgi:hypothetical protein
MCISAIYSRRATDWAAVDWLLRSDIGEVIKEIVHDEEHFPDYQIPKKPTGRKKRRR